MSFWRKCINFVFRLFFPLCAVGVFVFAIIAMADSDIGGWGLLIMFGGELIVVILFASLGMFLELCDNIAEIEKNVRTFGNSNNEDFWFCKACGEKNDRLSSYCQNCGRYK